MIDEISYISIMNAKAAVVTLMINSGLKYLSTDVYQS